MARTTCTAVLLMALVTAAGRSPGAKERPSVTYRLIDLAGVPPGILDAGAASAESAFSRVGLGLTREDVSARTVPSPMGECGPRLHVFVLGERAFRAAKPHPDAQGYTAAGAGGPPAAMISFHRVERTAARYGVARVVLLGHVIAHELGHLLLGRGSHGSAVMKEIWGSSELAQLAQGALMFSPAEQRQFRARIDQGTFATSECGDGRERSRVE